jgi:hypothetical protein
VALEREPDIVLVRKRTRRVAELLGFDRQDQARVTTAVSELARNAFEYAGGARAEFRVKDDPAPAHWKSSSAIRARASPTSTPCCRAASLPRKGWGLACAARNG